MSPLTVVVWTCVAVFLATAVVTLGALIGWIRCLGGGDCSNHHYYLKRLFAALILEIIGVSLSAYAEAFNSKDREQLETISQEIQKQKTKIIGPISLTPGNPPEKALIVRQVLQQKAYASSDGPATDEKLIKIPEGWRYVASSENLWTKTGDATYTVTPVFDPRTKEVKEVKLTANAESKKLFGPRNWVGVDLNIAIERERKKAEEKARP